MVETVMVYFEGKANRAFRQRMWSVSNKGPMDYFHVFNLTDRIE